MTAWGRGAPGECAVSPGLTIHTGVKHDTQAGWKNCVVVRRYRRYGFSVIKPPIANAGNRDHRGLVAINVSVVHACQGDGLRGFPVGTREGKSSWGDGHLSGVI